MLQSPGKPGPATIPSVEFGRLLVGPLRPAPTLHGTGSADDGPVATTVGRTLTLRNGRGGKGAQTRQGRAGIREGAAPGCLSLHNQRSECVQHMSCACRGGSGRAVGPGPSALTLAAQAGGWAATEGEACSVCCPGLSFHLQLGNPGTPAPAPHLLVSIVLLFSDPVLSIRHQRSSPPANPLHRQAVPTGRNRAKTATKTGTQPGSAVGRVSTQDQAGRACLGDLQRWGPACCHTLIAHKTRGPTPLAQTPVP